MLTRRCSIDRVALGLVLAAAAAGALAADAPSAQACRVDTKKLCAGMQPGGGRVMACLTQHESELSPDCKAVLPTLQQCAQQVQSLCGNTGDRREMRECLRSHADQFSPQCRRRQP